MIPRRIRVGTNSPNSPHAMAPWLRHTLLLPFLTAALAASTTGGSSLSATVTSASASIIAEENAHDARQAKPAQHNTPHATPQQRPPVRMQQQQRWQRWGFPGGLQRRRRRLREQPREISGKGRRGPFAALADAGDDLRARARRALQVAGGAMQRERYNSALVAGRGKERIGRTSSLAFGNFLRKLPEHEVKEELPSAEMLALQAENDASVEAVLSVIESDGWEHVTTKSDIVVVRKFMPPTASKASSGGGGVVDEGAAAKFACVKAMGTLNADANDLYKLFLDNERVHEYNDNCREVRDLEQLSADTKVSWAATPRYGPFKSRDFVTAVHYRRLEDGTLMVLNRPVEHPLARRGKGYVRAEILIATNIMRPNRDDPTKTDFISVTHINPGGIVDSKIGAKIANKLCAKAPVSLLVSLERSANSPPVPKKAPKKAAKVAG